MIVHLMCKESLVTMALHVVHLHHGMNAVHGQMLTLRTENFFGKELPTYRPCFLAPMLPETQLFFLSA